MKKTLRIALCMLFFAFSVFSAFPSFVFASADSPLAPPDRSSPGATLRSFLVHMNAGSRAILEARTLWDESPMLFTPPPEAAERLQTALRHFGRAMQCLDLSGVPEVIRDETGRESILLLKEILDRIGLPSAA